MKNVCILVILGLLIASVGCKSKKAHSDASRTKSVRAERQKANSTATTDLPADEGKFQKFVINDIPTYIATFAETAQREMLTYGIPASIKLAQGLLESGYGQGELAQKTNNHFGIKCHTGWQGEYDFHDDDAKGECFRKYNHPMYSYRDHSLFLTTRSRYAFLFDYDTTDYKSWATGLRKAGYATDKKYPQKLIFLIEKHQLHQYDTSVRTATYKKSAPAVAQENAEHIVKKGDTLYSLSKQYYVSVEELMKQNKLRNTSLSIGQKLTIRYSKN